MVQYFQVRCSRAPLSIITTRLLISLAWNFGSANYNVTDSFLYAILTLPVDRFVIYTLIPTVGPLNSCDQPYSWHILPVIPQFSYVRIRLWPPGTCTF